VSGCITPLALESLVDYWFEAGSTAEDARVEEHLFGCGPCSARLQQLANISLGIKRLVARGDFGAVVTSPFVARLKDAGLRVREYRVPAGGSVACTIAPQDDVVVGRLHASLAGITRLDMLVSDPERGDAVRLKDVPFDAAAGEVIFSPGTAYLRTLHTQTQRVELLAVAEAGERLVGEYTFNHYPHAQ
jgi:hypothetical protein